MINYLVVSWIVGAAVKLLELGIRPWRYEPVEAVVGLGILDIVLFPITWPFKLVGLLWHS